MWAKLIEFMAKVFALTSNVERLEKDVEKLQQENRLLLEKINQQKSQIDVLVYAVQAENEKTKMWVERELTKFERRLPSGKEKKDEKD